MSIQILFWILMLLWILAAFWWDYVPGQPYPYRRVPGMLLIFVLLALLGWRVFGAAIHQ